MRQTPVGTQREPRRKEGTMEACHAWASLSSVCWRDRHADRGSGERTGRWPRGQRGG